MSAEAAIAWLGYARENLRTAQWAFGKLRGHERPSALSPLRFRVPRPEAIHRVAAGDSLRRPKGRCFGFGGGSGAFSPTRTLSIGRGLEQFYFLCRGVNREPVYRSR